MNNNSNQKQIRYGVIPLDISIEELLIYHQLYKKVNFTDMTVKYTRSQLVADINVFGYSITENKVRSNIKKLIENGFIKILQKGSKGNPTIYKIITMSDVNNVDKNHQQTTNKTPTKRSNTNGCRGKTTNKPPTNHQPIKDKDKDIYYIKNNFKIYKKILYLYISKVNREEIILDNIGLNNIINSMNSYSINKINNLIESNTINQLIESINNYSMILNDNEYSNYNDYFIKNKYTLSNLILNYEKFINYSINLQNYNNYKNTNDINNTLSTTKRRKNRSVDFTKIYG